MKRLLIVGLLVVLMVSTLAIMGSAKNNGNAINGLGEQGATLVRTGENQGLWVPAQKQVERANEKTGNEIDNPVIHNPIDVAGS